MQSTHESASSDCSLSSLEPADFLGPLFDPYSNLGDFEVCQDHIAQVYPKGLRLSDSQIKNALIKLFTIHPDRMHPIQVKDISHYLELLREQKEWWGITSRHFNDKKVLEAAFNPIRTDRQLSEILQQLRKWGVASANVAYDAELLTKIGQLADLGQTQALYVLRTEYGIDKQTLLKAMRFAKVTLEEEEDDMDWEFDEMVPLRDKNFYRELAEWGITRKEAIKLGVEEHLLRFFK